MSTSEPGRVQAVERSLDILHCLSGGPQNLTDIAFATGLSKATTFRLLATLSHRSIVMKDARTSSYMLGPGCLALVDGVMAGLGALASAGRSTLERLRTESRETVQIHVRVSNQRVCVAEIPSPQPIRYSTAVGATAPLHVGSAGKVLLALMEPPELDRVLQSITLHPVTEATITDLPVLLQELRLTRERGYAISHGERFEGASGLSAPVRAGRVLAAVSILGPSSRLGDLAIAKLVPTLLAASHDLEQALGRLDGGGGGRVGGSRATRSARRTVGGIEVRSEP